MIRIIFLMGVSGSGKSYIGHLLSKNLNFQFLEGDAHHPDNNIKKMANGEALNDADRLPWLKKINKLVIKHQAEGVVVACSALKEDYRLILTQNLKLESYQWFFLDGSYELIESRLKHRSNHFMPTSLLQSQFETLQPPKNCLRLDISISADQLVEKISKYAMEKTQFGIMGLGVMGTSLSRNFASKGVRLSLYNRHLIGKEEEVAKKRILEYPELNTASGFDDLKQFIASIEKPRKILLVLTAGPAIDMVISELLNYLDVGDLLIDGGNSHFQDSTRREKALHKNGIHFIGMGISGGEKGALEGPSLMPGGSEKAYPLVAELLSLIAAKSSKGVPCCHFIGKAGSGHFVKTVHNGIEYAEMQLIAELYNFLKVSLDYDNEQIADCFAEWCTTDSNSYLLEISSAILRQKEGDAYLLDLILDKASHKGTGAWATVAGAELGVTVSMMAAALNARQITALKSERTKMSETFNGMYSKEILATTDIKKAYDIARLINHHQGFELLRAASTQYNWGLNLAAIAQTWTGGCIIKSTLMENLENIFISVNSILIHPELTEVVKDSSVSLKSFVLCGLKGNIPLTCFTEALLYFQLMTQGRSSGNMIQAQRDFFGAHQYQKTNDSSENWYHTQWDDFTP